MLVPRFLARGIGKQIIAGQPELGRDKICHWRRDHFARCEHLAEAQHAQLQRKAETVVGATALADMSEVLVAEGNAAAARPDRPANGVARRAGDRSGSRDGACMFLFYPTQCLR
jgi:hypothetical protein